MQGAVRANLVSSQIMIQLSKIDCDRELRRREVRRQLAMRVLGHLLSNNFFFGRAVIITQPWAGLARRLSRFGRMWPLKPRKCDHFLTNLHAKSRIQSREKIGRKVRCKVKDDHLVTGLRSYVFRCCQMGPARRKRLCKPWHCKSINEGSREGVRI